MAYNGYPFSQFNVDYFDKQNPLREIFYKFKTPKRVYLVRIEEYKNNIFVIKFHQMCDSHNKHKYSMIFNDGDAFKVFRTIISIFLEIHKKIPLSFFWFYWRTYN